MISFADVVHPNRSYVDSAVVRIGADTLEIKGGDSFPWFWVNGEPDKEGDFNHRAKKSIGGCQAHLSEDKKRRKALIHLTNGEQVMLKAFGEFIRVDVTHVNGENWIGALGMMGRFPDGNHVGRDGMTVIEDVNDFGMEWQVKGNDPILFHEAGGVKSPGKCALPDNKMHSKMIKRRLGSGMARSKAEEACSDITIKEEFDDCVADVIAVSMRSNFGTCVAASYSIEWPCVLTTFGSCTSLFLY